MYTHRIRKTKRFLLTGCLLFTLIISLAACKKQESTQPPKEAPPRTFSATGPRLMYLNRTFTCTITVLNSEQEQKKEVTVTSVLPQEVDFIASTPSGVFKPGNVNEGSPGLITWQLGDIPPGDRTVIKLELRAKERGDASIELKLTSPSETAALEETINTKIIGLPAMHISTYDTEDPVEVGKNTIYVIEVRNEGTSPCTNVKLESRIPKEMGYVEAEGPVAFKYKSGSILFEPYPILQPGDKLTYKMRCKALESGSAKHTAILTYDQFSHPILDEEGTSCYK